MDKKQRARCSGRGRGSQGGSQRDSLSPTTSPSRCTMQLRDPSTRKASSHRDDAYEWSPNSKGNRRNSTSKKLVVHLERIPDSTFKDYCPSEPPKLQHYLQDVEETVGVDQSDCDNTSAPPNLVPEVIVTQNKQSCVDKEFTPSTSSCGPSNFNKLSDSQEKLKNITVTRVVLPKTPPSKSDIKSCGLGDKNTKVFNIFPIDSKNVDMVVESEHAHVPREFSGKRNGSTSPSPCKKDDDDADSIGGWSDLSETLFQEPERISTGKELVEHVDGVDILTFESEKDMLEFTAIEMDHIYAPPTISCDELSAIVTTKTNDITKIKGWRTKYFAGRNMYSSDYESCVVDLDDLSKECSVSPVPYNSSTDIKEEREDGSMRKSTLQGTNVETRKALKEGKIHKSSNKSKLVAKGIGSPSNLDESWVKFAVSALVLPADTDSTTSKDHQSAEGGERYAHTYPAHLKKKLQFDDETKKEVRIGRPPLYPLSPYMKKKIKYLRDSFKKQSKSSSKISKIQRKYEILSSLKSNKLQIDVGHATDINKMKVNKELKKLGHVVIDMDENQRKYAQASSSQDSLSKECKNEFCKLGCVCTSIATLPQPQGHCGKVECMFECTCTNTIPNFAVEKLIENENRDLAPEEKQFRHAVITGGDGVVMVKQRGRREIKMPGRFRDDMLTGDALTAVIDNKRKSPVKPKPVKVTQSVPTYGKPLVKKSIFQCPNSQQYSQSAKYGCMKSDSKDHLGEYFNIPSPERLEEPGSKNTGWKQRIWKTEGSKVETAPLFNTEGGFISPDKEEALMAHHRKIKQEKPSDYDATIEIDDMDWQSMDTDYDKIPSHSEEFGKIVSITSLAPEEFDKTFSDDAATSALEEKILEQVNKIPKKPLAPGISSKQRALAKVRAKNLVEFFISNASVSALVKSAYEFKPSVLEREAITLLQWTSLKYRFQEYKIHIWITERRNDFHFIATENEEELIPGYVNLRTASAQKMTIPQVARELLQEHIVRSDANKCCIFWCNGMHWEFIGCLQKNRGGSSVPGMLPPNGKPKSLNNYVSSTTLPCDTVDTKWISISLGNDFEALELKHENLYVPYSKLNQLMSCCWRYKRIVYFDTNKAIQNIHPMLANFGFYAIPDDSLMIHLGPYDVTEHPLLELIPYEDTVCQSKIRVHVIPGRDKSEFLRPEVESKDILKQKEVRFKKTDSVYGNMPLVTSKGRTRKIPRHLLDDDDDDDLPTPRKKKVKKPVYQVESIEIPVLMPNKSPRRNEKAGRQRSISKDETENSFDNITSEFEDDFENEFLESYEESSRLEMDLNEENTGEKCASPARENSASEESSGDEGEKSESGSENEVEAIGETSRRQSKKSRRVVKTGSFAKLVCTLEGIEDVPIVLYDNGSIRFRNPYGIRVVHLENFQVATRFLNYIFKEKFPGDKFDWSLSFWTEQTPELEAYFKKLQKQRVRNINKKELDRTIGYEGRIMNRPIRHKFKPWKRKVVRKNAVVRVLEECEERGTDIQLGISVWKPTVKKVEQQTPKPSEIKAPPSYTKFQDTECSSPSTINENDDDMWLDDNNQWRHGEQRLLHRDMEKVRRRELALCFRTLASILVPPDMLERCSKIMVLLKANAEIKKIVQIDKEKTVEKSRLEARRDLLYKKFSQVIEGLGPSEKAHQVHQLKELLDALKNSVPRQNWSVSQPDISFPLLDETLPQPPPKPSPVVAPCKYSPHLHRQPAKAKQVKKPISKFVLKKKNRRRVKPIQPEALRSLPPGVRVSKPMLCTDEAVPHTGIHISAPPAGKDLPPQQEVIELEPSQESLSSGSLPDEQREELPTPEPGSSNSEDIMADLPAEPAIVIREPGKVKDISRSQDLPSHVRITKDATIYFPSTKKNTSLTSRKIAAKSKPRDHLFYKYIGHRASQDLIELSDEEGGPSKKTKVSETEIKPLEKSRNRKDLDNSSNDSKKYEDSFEITITKIKKKPEDKNISGSSNSVEGESKLFSLLSEKSNIIEPDIIITKEPIEKPKSDLKASQHGVSPSASTCRPSASRSSFSLTVKHASNNTPAHSKPAVSLSSSSSPFSTVRMPPMSSQENATLISMPNQHTTIRRPNCNVIMPSSPPLVPPKATETNIKPPNSSSDILPSTPNDTTTTPLVPKFSISTNSSKGTKMPVPVAASSIKGPVPVPTNSRPLLMTQNGKRYLIMPGGKKNEDPKLVAKYAALADIQQKTVTPSVTPLVEKKHLTFNAPKFRIDKELMRARLNAVKPRSAESTSNNDSTNENESTTSEPQTSSDNDGNKLSSPNAVTTSEPPETSTEVTNEVRTSEPSTMVTNENATVVEAPKTSTTVTNEVITSEPPKTSIIVPEVLVPEVLPSIENKESITPSNTAENTTTDDSSKTEVIAHQSLE